MKAKQATSVAPRRWAVAKATADMVEYEIVDKDGKYELRSRPVVEWTVRGVFTARADAVSCMEVWARQTPAATEPPAPKPAPKLEGKHPEWTSEESEVLERYRDKTPWPYTEIRAELRKARPGGPVRSNSSIIARYSRTAPKKEGPAVTTSQPHGPQGAAAPPVAAAPRETEEASDGAKEPPLDRVTGLAQLRKCLTCGHEWQGWPEDSCPNRVAHQYVKTADAPSSFIRALTREEMMGGRRPKDAFGT